MTDSERDQIDQDAQIFMRTCSEAIRQLRHEGASRALRVPVSYELPDDSRSVFHDSPPEQLSKESAVFLLFFHLSVPLAEKQVTSAQIKEHRVVVLDLTDTYLKSKFILLF